MPAGAKTDGASIPRILWLTYPPFTGKYRQAAVVHDYYCQLRSRTWKDTHKVFYDAMRTSGVPEKTAKIMYGAVYGFGPRWGTRSEQRAPAAERTSQSRSSRRRSCATWKPGLHATIQVRKTSRRRWTPDACPSEGRLIPAG